MEMEIKVLKLDPDLPLPTPARPGDAGIDLYAAEDVSISPGGGRQLVPTGLAIEIPPNYAGFVLPRSGLALRHGVTCANSPGLIDSGYRGELKVALLNTDPKETFEALRGTRIAQLVIQPIATPVLIEVTELSVTERGEQGFGSSGS